MLATHLVQAALIVVYLVPIPHHSSLTCSEFAAFAPVTDSQWRLKTAVCLPFCELLAKPTATLMQTMVHSIIIIIIIMQTQSSI